MNVLVISSNQNKQPVTVMPIGACIAAEAAEKSGHNVSFLDLMFVKNVAQEVEKVIYTSKPNVVGISLRNIDDNDMKNPRTFFDDVSLLAQTIKKRINAKIILGGAAVPIMPQQLLRYTQIDLAVLGFGETVFPKLLETIENKKPLEDVEGIAWIEKGYFRKNEINGAKFNNCPVPDYNRWLNIKSYLSRFSTVPMQTKRGCPYKCVYCTYATIEGENYHLSRPKDVVNELEKLADAGIHDVEIVDNVFNSPYGHAMEICECLSQANLPLRLQSMELNPKFIDDALLDAMERAGFVGIGLTAESADDKVLENLGKNYTAQDVYRAAQVISRHNLPCFWIFLIGGPRETPDTVKRTLDFASRNIRKSDTVFFNVGIRIYPETELERIARADGVLNVAAEEMLEAKFYFSPLLNENWLHKTLAKYVSENLNFIDSDSFTLPTLGTVQRLAYHLGIKQPLWRHTRTIRRIMQLTGIYK